MTSDSRLTSFQCCTRLLTQPCRSPKMYCGVQSHALHRILLSKARPCCRPAVLSLGARLAVQTARRGFRIPSLSGVYTLDNSTFTRGVQHCLLCCKPSAYSSETPQYSLGLLERRNACREGPALPSPSYTYGNALSEGAGPRDGGALRRVAAVGRKAGRGRQCVSLIQGDRPCCSFGFWCTQPGGFLSLTAVCVFGPHAREGASVVAASIICEASSVFCSAQHEARYRQPCLLSLPAQQTLLPMALAPARTVRHLQPSPKVKARQCLPPAHNLDLLLLMPVMLSMYKGSVLLASSRGNLVSSNGGDFRRHLAGVLLHVHDVSGRAGELSSLPQQPLQAAEQQVMSREAIAHPSGSLISTAMRPSAHAARQPRSPPAERATSVVSKTALRRSPEAVRAGTPASVYAQDRAPPHRALDTSPHDSQAMEQASNMHPHACS